MYFVNVRQSVQLIIIAFTNFMCWTTYECCHPPCDTYQIFPTKGKLFYAIWLRNRSISTGLEPVLSQTEKSCNVSQYRQFYRMVK